MGFGAVIGPAALALLSLVLNFGQGPSAIPYDALAPLAFGGLFSGGIFWLIRRPDRDILVEEAGDEPKT
jgi:hypothetical protein